MLTSKNIIKLSSPLKPISLANVNMKHQKAFVFYIFGITRKRMRNLLFNFILSSIKSSADCLNRFNFLSAF